MANLFPAFLKLEGRACLVVGAGTVAEQKIAGLLASGAHVRVVAPEACRTIQEWERAGRLTWTKKTFEAEDLAGVMLVIGATGDVDVNATVFREAERQRVLCNAVDEPEHCHFYYPAVVKRGDLQIAISTNGHSPALAQRLRRELEVQFGTEYGDWLRWLGAVRTRLFRSGGDSEKRKSALHRLASRERYDRYAARHRRNGDQ